MTAQIRKHLTVSFESSSNGNASSEVASTFAESSARARSSEIPPPDPASHEGTSSPCASSEASVFRAQGFEADSEPCPNDLPSFPGLPAELKQALRAGRTPLIEGVDYGSPAYKSAPPPPIESERVDAARPPEKARVDTLSPSESVPPPAPYLASASLLRPSVVPPVRSPYIDPLNPRAQSDGVPRGIRSDPPPRIPISDRPSRIGFRSDPPPRLSHSEPPPSPNATVPSSRRKPERALPLADSPEALRREAVTIQADAHPGCQSGAMDPVRSAASRVPTFSPAPLPYTMRQHENNQLRNVAMAMMFVIFIVTGAIAGIRWFVARESERGVVNPVSGGDLSNGRDPAVQKGAAEPPQSHVTERRAPEPNAEAAPELPATALESTPARDAIPTSVPVSHPRPAAVQGSAAKSLRVTDLNERNPWAQTTPRSKRPVSTKASTNEVDTKTPLFSPRQ